MLMLLMIICRHNQDNQYQWRPNGATNNHIITSSWEHNANEEILEKLTN